MEIIIRPKEFLKEMIMIAIALFKTIKETWSARDYMNETRLKSKKDMVGYLRIHRQEIAFGHDLLISLINNSVQVKS
jgi:hypothetical protein